jgi:hypothetical protein
MKWTKKDEAIVCLAYKLQKTGQSVNLTHLSTLTGKSETSINMKLKNFQYLDTGAGLNNVSKKSKETFNNI